MHHTAIMPQPACLGKAMQDTQGTRNGTISSQYEAVTAPPGRCRSACLYLLLFLEDPNVSLIGPVTGH